MGIFSEINAALAAQGKPSLFKQVGSLFAPDYGEYADALCQQWLAAEIAERTALTREDAACLLGGISAAGDADLRTLGGMALASSLLGVSGDPIAPTSH